LIGYVDLQMWVIPGVVCRTEQTINISSIGNVFYELMFYGIYRFI